MCCHGKRTRWHGTKGVRSFHPARVPLGGDDGLARASLAPSTMGDEPPARRVGLFGMVVMGFFWVCGGMYGNEELLGTAPPALVLLALIVVPCCHSLPVSMMIAECGTAWPADGGLPVFVQHAFGDTIGGHNTFFTWLNCLVDAAIYPVMAASYTRELLGHYQVVVDERLTCVVIVVLMRSLSSA